MCICIYIYTFVCVRVCAYIFHIDRCVYITPYIDIFRGPSRARLGVHKLKDGELREMVAALDVDQSLAILKTDASDWEPPRMLDLHHGFILWIYMDL